MYIVKKRIHGKEYFYLCSSKREKGKVKTRTVAYLGKTRKLAEKKAKEIRKKDRKESVEKKKETGPVKKIKVIKEITIEDMAVFCKRKGLVYPSAEIYGGFAGFWDYGPLGTELKNNLKSSWWRYFIKNREDVVGMDGSIITHPQIWKASGHVDLFVDVAVQCEKCGDRTKLDQGEIGKTKCPKCGSDYKKIDEFNTMLTTKVGPLEKESIKAYLRPETAQLIFADYKLVQENARLKLPFGIAQIGKAFRNEISPRDFLFRAREFEQMELQYFINPNKINDCAEYDKIKYFKIKMLTAKEDEEQILTIEEMLRKGIFKNKWHAYWLYASFNWFLNIGINKENLRLREHKKEELAHYAKAVLDIEYNFSGRWGEIAGSHDRGQYDLTQHEKTSKKDMKIYDEETKQKILAHVIESSFGFDRTFLALLFDAYKYDESRENILLILDPILTPYKIGIFPLVNKLDKEARKVYEDLKKEFHAFYDKSGSIGRRYARQDEIGTPYCITIDFDTLRDKAVTIRDRDTTKQIRVKIKKLNEIIKKLLSRDIEFEKVGKLIK